MELLPQLRRRARLLRFHPAQPRDHRSARHAEPLVPRLLGLPVSLYLQAHPSRPAALGSDRVGSMALGRDMLQVGCAHGPGGASDPGLTLPETRTHFYAWVIVSSPLTLSHNVNGPIRGTLPFRQLSSGYAHRSFASKTKCASSRLRSCAAKSLRSSATSVSAAVATAT